MVNISAISDLKLAKENISLRNLAFLLYEEAILTGLTNTYNASEDACFL
jgi:hypothetical protein